MNPQVLAQSLASAQEAHAALVARAKESTGDTAEQLWILAGAAHRIASNYCILLATASLEREKP